MCSRQRNTHREESVKIAGLLDAGRANGRDQTRVGLWGRELETRAGRAGGSPVSDGSKLVLRTEGEHLSRVQWTRAGGNDRERGFSLKNSLLTVKCWRPASVLQRQGKRGSVRRGLSVLGKALGALFEAVSARVEVRLDGLKRPSKEAGANGRSVKAQAGAGQGSASCSATSCSPCRCHDERHGRGDACATNGCAEGGCRVFIPNCARF